VRATGVGEKNWDDKGAAAGCLRLDAGFWYLVAGCWLMFTGIDHMVFGGLHVESDSSGW